MRLGSSLLLCGILGAGCGPKGTSDPVAVAIALTNDISYNTPVTLTNGPMPDGVTTGPQPITLTNGPTMVTPGMSMTLAIPYSGGGIGAVNIGFGGGSTPPGSFVQATMG